MPSGKIVKVVADRGYGFIKPEDAHSRDIFFHFSGLVNPDDFATLKLDQRVQYELDHKTNRPRAVDIQ